MRQQLPGARRPPRAGRGGREGGGRARLRHGVGPVHLRHRQRAPRARGAALGLPGHRGHDPVLLVLRREHRAVRDHHRAAGRDHLRRAEPRLDHRRRAAVQGPPAALRQLRHGRARGPAHRGRRRPAPRGGHRRRLLDGRRGGRPAGDLRPGRVPRRAGRGGRLARGGLRRGARSRHPGGDRDGLPGRRADRHAGQGAGWGVRRLHLRPARAGRVAAPAVAPLPVLQLPGAGGRRHLDRGAGPHRTLRRPARAPGAQRRAVPRRR